MKLVVTQKQQRASTFTGILWRKPMHVYMAASMILLFSLFFSLTVNAQNNIRVKGSVRDEKGQPVAKASVLVKGTSTGISSDENGNFEITAPSNGILIISAVGLGTKEVRINGQSQIN